jgi:hypothetical protein
MNSDDNPCRTEFFAMISAFGAGFLILAGMCIAAYHWSEDNLSDASTKIVSRIEKLDDKVTLLGTTATRTETKLDDLIARNPPVKQPLRQ